MRTIKVKPGASKYKLVSDDGLDIGEIGITLKDVKDSTGLLTQPACFIGISKRHIDISITAIASGKPKRRRKRT